MTERTGLGIVETAMLRAIRRATLRPDAVLTKCSRIVDLAEEEEGVTRGWAYETLRVLGNPGFVTLTMFDFHGNFGSADFDPAPPTHTEARLSPAGVLALDAESGVVAPLPLGLIIGDIHFGGRRPGFDPLRVVTACTRLLQGQPIKDEELIRSLGTPVFPTGCEIGGDLRAMALGEPTVLELSCRIQEAADRSGVVLTNLPPGIGPHRLAYALTSSTEDLDDDPDWPYELEPLSGVKDVLNLSDSSGDKVVVRVRPATDLERLKVQLRRRRGVTKRVEVRIPKPLAALVRPWVDTSTSEDLVESLGKLRVVLDQGNRHPISWRQV